jgi:hypothetical protein
MRLLITSLILIAWSALWIILGMNGFLEWVKLPDWAFTVIILVPLITGVALLIVIKAIFRMTGY